MKLPAEGPKDFDFHHDLPTGPYGDEITVAWGEADPAQIAYTANIPAWGLKTIEAWMKACTGVGWYEMNLDLGIGTPFVELACQFKAPVTPRHPLQMTLTLTRLGRSALTCHLDGRQNGRLCFSGDFVCVFTGSVDLKPIPIPPLMRSNMQRFATRQGSPFEDADAR